MKYHAGVYGGQGSAYIEERELPPCGPRDIIVKNIYTGICGSDIDIFKNGPGAHFYKPGHEFGHEMISVIVEVGSEVKDLQVGQRVYPFGVFAKPRSIGGMSGFSEYMHLPDAKSGYGIIPVPDEISDKAAALIEPFQIGTKAARMGEPKEGKGAVVFGAGIIGMTAAFGLKAMGCKEVMVCDIVDNRLDVAADFGFAVCNTAGEELREKGKQVFGPNTMAGKDSFDADIFIDATGVKAVPETFQKVAKFGAALVVVGVHNEPRPIDLKLITYSQHRIQGSAGYEHVDIPLIFEILKKYNQELERLITHEFCHADLQKAIEQATKSDEAMKVVIKF